MGKACRWIIPGLMILLLDRLVKVLCAAVDIVPLPGVLGLRTVHNTGMALGLFAGSGAAVLLLSAALVAACVYLMRGMRLTGLAPIAISLMAGGAIGNAVDRAIYGYVIDMFELLFMDFYIFNVADIGVVAGAVLCGFSLLFRPGDWSKK